MNKVGIEDAQTRLAELIEQAADGGDVVIAHRNGTAVRLVPVQPDGVPRFGSARGMFSIADDFDAPLEDFAPYEQ
ncbi:MAG TPA: type II toxin-antitoxin system prevent-host-death family antitoxin [Longimicrobium sp.]|jgi:prevent-host-death family protein